MTKLTGITFQSRDEAQAENYRKMMIAMATDIRVILIKLADRLHNMRTLEAMPKQKQIDKAKETLEIYAPLAHRLGIHAIKWELEDLAFQTLHPRKYTEIKGLVNQQREERERYVAKAGGYLNKELEALGIRSEISGRAKHFYSIYSKMTRKGREFNEIYDLTAMRVIVDSVKDCYGAVGVIHSLWKPLPGRFKDMVAMPKFNMYQALHTTVIGPEGRPLEIQIRTRDMHETAEYGVAAHWRYKEGASRANGVIDPSDNKLKWLKGLLDWQQDVDDPAEFTDTLRSELVEDEVYVFTPKGEVKSLAAGATPLDFAYEVHTDVGHRCVGAKVNGKIVPLHYELQSGDIVEVLTSKRERGPSRDWLAVVKTTRARNKIRAWFKAESREDSEHTGRQLLQEHLHKAGLPAQKLTGSPLLADVIREMGFKKADDFYIALGGAKISAKVVVNKVMQRLKQGEAGVEEPSAADSLLDQRRSAQRRPESSSLQVRHPGRGRRRRPAAPRQVLPPGVGRPDPRLRLARPRHHHPPRGLPERRRPAQGPGALRPGRPGTARTRPRSRSSCRSTRGTATACSRTSRARSRRPASTSSRRAASSRTRWSRTASSSRWGTRRRSRAPSTACARSTPCSTPTASRRPAASSRPAVAAVLYGGGDLALERALARVTSPRGSQPGRRGSRDVAVRAAGRRSSRASANGRARASRRRTQGIGRARDADDEEVEQHLQRRRCVTAAATRSRSGIPPLSARPAAPKTRVSRRPQRAGSTANRASTSSPMWSPSTCTGSGRPSTERTTTSGRR